MAVLSLCSSIVDMVLDHQDLYSPLGDELRKKVRETLLKQHHHQNQKKLANRLPLVRSIADIGRKTSELHLDKNGGKTWELRARLRYNYNLWSQHVAMYQLLEVF